MVQLILNYYTHVITVLLGLHIFQNTQPIHEYFSGVLQFGGHTRMLFITYVCNMKQVTECQSMYS